jgi:hypothetical protein
MTILHQPFAVGDFISVVWETRARALHARLAARDAGVIASPSLAWDVALRGPRELKAKLCPGAGRLTGACSWRAHQV